MKITISELMAKINSVKLTINNLREKDEICNKAANFLEEYIDMLLDIKVDI